MSTITALTRQKRNPDRINLYLDGEFAFGLAAITAVGLRVGQALSTEKIAELQAADGVEKAKQSAIRYIEYRPRSTGEVRKNLQKKGYDEAVIDNVVDRLQEVALLDDAAFARYWVEQREAFRPRSRMALRQELRQKGLAREAIETAVSTVDEYAAASRAVEKKLSRWQTLDEQGFRKKMGGFLQRRGFPYDIVRAMFEQYWPLIQTQQEESST